MSNNDDLWCGWVDRVWDRTSVEYELPIKTSKRMQKKRENVTLITTITIIIAFATTTLIIMDWWIEDGIGWVWSMSYQYPPNPRKENTGWPYYVMTIKLKIKVMMLTIELTMLLPSQLQQRYLQATEYIPSLTSHDSSWLSQEFCISAFISYVFLTTLLWKDLHSLLYFSCSCYILFFCCSSVLFLFFNPFFI